MRVVAAAAAVVVLALPTLAAPIHWHEDLRTAHAVAQKENKPLLLHFTTDNCVWCDRLEAGAFASAEVQSAVADGYVPVKIHAGRQPQLAKMFKVTRFPTDVIVTTTGEALVHRTSPQPAAEYTAMLRQNAPVTAVASQPKATPKNPIAQTAAIGGPASFEPPVTPAGMMPPMPSMAKPPTQPASSRVAGLSMPPMQSPPASPVPAAKRTAASTNPTLALEGHCSVTVMEDGEWKAGSPEFGVIHLGQLYLFADADKMQRFLDNPIPYTPMLNGIDVVRFFEERRIVEGSREFSAVVDNRVFLFADEDALTHFENTCDRYIDSAIAVMDKAVSVSNP